MAKGKHAASAAKRRLDAANEHTDRLTDQLAELKIRLRAAEKEAARSAVLEEALADARRQIEESSYPEVDRLNEMLRHQQERAAAAEAEQGRIKDLWERAADNIIDFLEANGMKVGPQKIETLLALINPEKIGVLVDGPHQTKLGQSHGLEAVRRVQRASGYRPIRPAMKSMNEIVSTEEADANMQRALSELDLVVGRIEALGMVPRGTVVGSRGTVMTAPRVEGEEYYRTFVESGSFGVVVPTELLMSLFDRLERFDKMREALGEFG